MIRIATTCHEDRAELLRAIGNFRFRLRQCRNARSPFMWGVLHGFACGVASLAEYRSRLARLADAVAEHASREADRCEKARGSIRVRMEARL